MTQPNDEQLSAHDPADSSPAEGGSDSRMTSQERGQAPHQDPADKDQPAEGGRDEGSDE